MVRKITWFQRNFLGDVAFIWLQLLQIFEIKSWCSCGTVYRGRVFQIWILKDLNRCQVICKQNGKYPAGRKKIICIMGIFIMTTKHNFPQEWQLQVTKRRNIHVIKKSPDCVMSNKQFSSLILRLVLILHYQVRASYVFFCEDLAEDHFFNPELCAGRYNIIDVRL